MSYFLAADAGGTKTDLLLADDRNELARVRTGSIKRMRVDAETAEANLTVALQELAAQTGISLSAISRTCIGTAGESVALVTDWLRSAFGARVGGELLIVGDVEIALDAAFPGEPGVLVLAGTGSNVAGRRRDGSLTTAGGWGPALADQGSGHRIGSEALRAAFLARDEGRTTSLFEPVLKLWKLRNMDELVAEANRVPPPDVSRLVEIVLHCAEQGDAVAQEVLLRQGEELAHLALLVMRRVRTRGDWTPPIAFAGSILERVRPVREALENRVRQEFPAVRIVQEIVDPLEGALWRARGTKQN